MRRIKALLLSALCVAGLLAAPVYAAEDGSTVVPRACTLSIDSENRYAGMERSYAEGYVPTIQNGTVLLTLPVLCSGTLEGNLLRASVTLGDTGTMPFVCKNYEKTVYAKQNAVNGKPAVRDSYLVSFPLELAAERVNGSYPVTLTLAGTDTAGSPVSGVYTVFVTITDGSDPNSKEPEPAETLVFAPKLLVTSYECTAESGEIVAGEDVTLRVTLTNTSKYQPVCNMTVAVAAPNESFHLLTASDTQYIEYLGTEESVDIAYHYQIGLGVEPGQYTFPVSYDFYYSKAVPGQGTGNAKMTVGGKVCMGFDPPSIPAEVTVTDTVEAQLQAMNLSRVTAYNVRAVIAVDGLRPAGTVFFGDLDGGNAQTASTQLAVCALSGGASAYGRTEGTVTYYYEDADGNAYSEVIKLALTVKSPFTASAEQPQDEPGQWWIIMAVLLTGAAVLGCGLVILQKRRKRKHESDS